MKPEFHRTYPVHDLVATDKSLLDSLIAGAKGGTRKCRRARGVCQHVLHLALTIGTLQGVLWPFLDSGKGGVFGPLRGLPRGVNLALSLSAGPLSLGAWWRSARGGLVAIRARALGGGPRVRAWWRSARGRLVAIRASGPGGGPRVRAWWRSARGRLVAIRASGLGGGPRVVAWWRSARGRLVAIRASTPGRGRWRRGLVAAGGVVAWLRPVASGARLWKRRRFGFAVLSPFPVLGHLPLRRSSLPVLRRRVARPPDDVGACVAPGSGEAD
jgi:hypothetical protein